MKIRKYSIQYKLKCLELVKRLGIYGTSKVVGINKSSLKNWYLNEEKLKTIKNKNSTYRIPSIQSKIKYDKYEKEILNLINRCKEIGLPLNTGFIIDEYCRICPEIQNKSKQSLKSWCYRFLRKYNLNLSDIKLC